MGVGCQALVTWTVRTLQLGAPATPTTSLGSAPAVVLLAGIVAFLGYNISIGRNGTVLTSASISLTPVYAAGFAIALIGERLAWFHGVALGLVVTGLLLINRGQAMSAQHKHR